MYKNAANLYNTLLAIYFNDYNNITGEEKEEMDKIYDPSNFFLKDYKHDKWDKKDLKKSKLQLDQTIAEIVKLRSNKSDMPSLESVEEVKEGKVLKTLIIN